MIVGGFDLWVRPVPAQGCETVFETHERKLPIHTGDVTGVNVCRRASLCVKGEAVLVFGTRSYDPSIIFSLFELNIIWINILFVLRHGQKLVLYLEKLVCGVNEMQAFSLIHFSHSPEGQWRDTHPMTDKTSSSVWVYQSANILKKSSWIPRTR